MYLICSVFSFSQLDNSKKLTFGFGFELSKTNISISKSSLPTKAQVIDAYGFGLGILSNYKLTNMVSLSLNGNLNFVNSYIYFFDVNESQNEYKIMQTNVGVSSHFLIKTSTNVNSPYFIFGPAVKIPLYTKEEKNNNLFFRNNTSALLDLGFGFNQAFKNVNFMPEFVYSFGLSNINGSPLLANVLYNQLAIIISFKN